MKVTARFHGILADWVGVPRMEVDLPEGATLADLLSRIRTTSGENMPSLLREKNEEEFRKAFWAVRNSLPLGEPLTVLQEGDELQFFFPLAGG